MSSVNYDDFIVAKKEKTSQTVFVRTDLSTTDKDEPYVIGCVTVSPQGKTYQLKRCADNKFFDPQRYTKNTVDDVAFSDMRREPRWVKVNKVCYERYLEFLESGSRLAFNIAEQEYNSI